MRRKGIRESSRVQGCQKRIMSTRQNHVQGQYTFEDIVVRQSRVGRAFLPTIICIEHTCQSKSITVRNRGDKLCAFALEGMTVPGISLVPPPFAQ